LKSSKESSLYVVILLTRVVLKEYQVFKYGGNRDLQIEWLIGIIGVFGLIAIIGFAVAFIIIGLCLGVALGPVHGENRELGSTFVTAFYIALTYLVMLIPVIGIFLFCVVIILQWYIIKSRHEVGWGGAIVAWIITIIIIAIVLILITLALGVGILALLGGFP
jgi:hypothetical protein